MMKSLHDIFLAQAFTPLDGARLRWVEYMNYYRQSKYTMSSRVDSINLTIYDLLSSVYPNDFLRAIPEENKKTLRDLAE